MTNSYVKKPRTIAPFWVLLVEFNKDERRKYLNGLLTVLRDESEFGGYPPLPSVSRRDELFNSGGNYWQGGVWPPMVWIVIKGLEKNGFRDDAQMLRRQMYRLMSAVFEERETVFEYYTPSLINGKASPGFYNKVEAKKDF